MAKEPSEMKLTDQAIADLRAQIGSEFNSKDGLHLEEASKDAIRHWAHATGDLDPKWIDAEYAATTRFGEITAPPSMLYGFDMRAIGSRQGMPGVHSFFGGGVHEWYLPIRRNDQISLKVILKDVVEK